MAEVGPGDADSPAIQIHFFTVPLAEQIGKKIVAYGEVVTIDGSYGVRVTSLEG